MKDRFALFFFLSLLPVLAQAEVDVSTATGKSITYDSKTGVAVIEGDAVVNNSTATLKADKITLNNRTKRGRAEGNIRLEQSSSTLTGTEADYSWDTGTGTISGAMGVNPPWRFTAKRMTQLTPNLYLLEDGTLTTCDEDPPHYKMKSKWGKVWPGKRITLENAEFVPEDTPVMYLPFYTHSLVPKKYRLRIEPGHTSRDGYTAKTSLGYPFSPNTYTTFRWDYLERTGNGFGLTHSYNAPKIKGNFDSYYIDDTNADLEGAERRRYTILWNHFQKFTSRLSANGLLDVKSDQTFGNVFSNAGNQVLVENQTRGLLSEGGLNYQFPMASLQAQVSRQDKFDSTISSRQFISQLTLPSLTFNTSPLKNKHIPFYTSFNASFVNNTQDRIDPTQSLHYQETATSGMEMKKDIKVGKNLTLTPLVNYQESWQNRVVNSTGVLTDQHQYIGRYTTGLDARRRFFRWLDARAGYRYTARNRYNQTRQDVLADDQGVETNQMTDSLQTRIGRSTLVTLASGYDWRNAPLSQPDKYTHVSERVLPPSLDTQVELKKNVNLYFRETYSIFDNQTRTPVGTPANTSGEIQLGSPTSATFFSQGFTFTKEPSGSDSELFLNNKLKFYLTPKWYLDLLVSYRAVGNFGVNYKRVFPIERTIRVVRDLHCWVLRAEFSSRPGVTEASFYVDLKTNLTPSKNVFQNLHPSVYSTRNDGPDYGELFPETKKEEPPK